MDIRDERYLSKSPYEYLSTISARSQIAMYHL